jgi:hypothetical protein
VLREEAKASGKPAEVRGSNFPSCLPSTSICTRLKHRPACVAKYALCSVEGPKKHAYSTMCSRCSRHPRAGVCLGLTWQVVEKMVTGRLRKYYKDSVLLEQECVIGEEGGSVAEVRGVVPPALPSLTVVLRVAHHPRPPPPSATVRSV